MAWPEGVTHAFDLPWNFVQAFQLATTVLNWQENLPSEDIPPRVIWTNGPALDEHFRKVKKKWSGDKQQEEFRQGSWDEAEAGHSVTLRNPLAETWRRSILPDFDDFSQI